jgi:hypothetical protein
MAKRKPIHPAIVALRAEHKRFRASVTEVGACFESDLKHDERAINGAPNDAIVWMISPHGTHMVRTGTPAECYAAVTRPWETSDMARYVNAVCVGCYDRDSIDRGWLQLFVWDGTQLTRYATLPLFKSAIGAVMVRRALSHLESQLVIAREDLAAMRSFQSDAPRYENQVDQINREIETLTLSGWGSV